MLESPSVHRILMAVGFALALAIAAPTPLPAQDSPVPPELRLGTLSFENSGSAAAQPAFERGMLLLHSFEYGPAAEAFREAQETDPDFAMAYWGEAMTHNHPVWMQQDRDAALVTLGRLAPTPAERAAKAGPAGGGTEREAAYLRAIDVLYGEGAKEERDDAYARTIRELHETYPEDEDAAAFYALALLGTAHEGRDFGTYMKSAGTLEMVVEEHPGHPGIAHYLIHSYDDPIHAPLGLRAARAYSEIAPDAAHAQHMTSHIFVALGMWDDVVSANENSMRVVNRDRTARGLGPGACGHYNFWLEYGYLQQGRNEDALRLLRECYDRVLEAAGGDAPDPDNTPIGSYAQMLSRYVVDSGEAYTPALDWPLDLSASPHAGFTMAFAQGWAAAEREEADGVRAAIDRARGLDADLANAGGEDDAWIQRRRVLLMELESRLRGLEGDGAGAVALAREAAEAEAAMPFEFGPPFIDKPTYELLGEQLVEAAKPEEARAAFRTALARTPHRVAAERGLAALDGDD
jgi:tetratricopeptide (TPR) repeat protein